MLHSCRGIDERRVEVRTEGRASPDRLAIMAGALVVEAIPIWRHGYGIGGNVVVRCQQGTPVHHDLAARRVGEVGAARLAQVPALPGAGITGRS